MAPTGDFNEPLDFLPKLWATRKVGFLLEQIRVNGELQELRDEVIMLAKKFGLVTPYTSYLAVDDSEFERPQPVQRPLGRRSDRSVNKSANPRRLGSGEGSTSQEEAPLDWSDKPQRPAPPSDAIEIRPSKKKRASRSRDLFGGFEAESGADGVAASEATREYKDAEKVASDEAMSTRWVAGRTFQITDGVWVEQGVSAKAKGMIEVAMYSSAYFALARKHKEISQVATLGDRVIIKLDGRIYQIVPAPAK